MKKIIAILLVLAFLLAGCSQNSAPHSGTVEQIPTESPVVEKEVSLGRMEGGVYTNTYAGFGCKLDSTWTFLSAEELQQLPENVAEMFKDTEMATDLTQISDMMAENVDEMITMNVLYTKVPMAERVLYAAMSDEEVVDATLAQKDAMISAYEQAGLHVDSMEKVTVWFLGEECAALHTACTVEGYPYYILQIFDYHLGQYGVTLTLSSYIEDNTASMLDLFYAVE